MLCDRARYCGDEVIIFGSWQGLIRCLGGSAGKFVTVQE